MTGQRRAVTAREQREPIIEARRNALNAERWDARRGKLDGQRNAVKASRNRGHGRCDAGVWRESRFRRPRAREEEPHRVIPEDAFVHIGAFMRHRQGRHPINVFAFDPQGLTAGDQQGHARTAP